MGPCTTPTLPFVSLVGTVALVVACGGSLDEPGRQGEHDAGLSGSSAIGPSPERDPVTAAGAPDCGGGVRVPIASGLRIREIALYQAVKVSLYMQDAGSAARSAPVIQGKRALVRVFVDPLSGYQARAVRGVLALQDGPATTTLVDERMISAGSTDAQRGSTFNFDVPGQLIGSDTTVRVELQELDCNAPSADPANAVFPSAEDGEPLAAVSVGPLRVTIVPVSMQGRLPLTTERELVAIRAALEAYYPVPRVELAVRRPIIATFAVPPGDDKAWSDMLYEIERTRMEDGVEDDMYYLGVMQPDATFHDYCGSACQLGLAPQVKTRDPSHQVALVASFADAQTYESIVHELGHAHGRGHAPCTRGPPPAGVDPDFPDQSGATGSWGWDVRSDELLPPTYKDVMGYCMSNWISVYHYNLNAERSREVNVPPVAALAKAGVARTRHLLWYADGSARWGAQSAQLASSGELERADVFDGQGQMVEQIAVGRVSLSHNGTELLELPEPDPTWSRVVLGGRELSFTGIRPAR